MAVTTEFYTKPKSTDSRKYFQEKVKKSCHEFSVKQESYC